MRWQSKVRARKSPWIETPILGEMGNHQTSGLVRARGLKHTIPDDETSKTVRARKSPWIETPEHRVHLLSGHVRARKSPWIEIGLPQSHWL